MAIQYNRPCEGRRLPGTSATTRDVGCQVLRKKKRWNTCVFSMFFVGGFLRYNKLSHQIFIKKHSPKTNGWNPKNWWFESMFFPFVKGVFSRFIALGLLGPVLRVSRFQHTYSQHRGF